MKWRCPHELGSKAWLEYVYASPPARDPRGRSRPTQRASPNSPTLKRSVGIEGGNELTAYLLLELLHACGLVRRFKEQPFELDPDRYGSAAIPDFIFEWYDGTPVVAEVKSSAFYTADKERVANELAGLLNAHSLRYVVWTTREHLTRVLWHNVRQIYRRRQLVTERGELERLAIDLGPSCRTLGQLIDLGHDQDTILHAVCTGRAHLNLLEKRDVSSKLYRLADAANYAALVGARPDPNSWWNALPDR